MHRQKPFKPLPYFILAFAAMIVLPACDALNQADIPATVVAQNAALATEIVILDEMAAAESSESSARAAELATSAAQINGVNAQLVGTLQVVVTPTPPLQADAFDPMTPSAPGEVGQRLYVNSGVSTDVRSSDGCVVDPREQFSPFVSRLYATFVAFNLTAGTLFRVEWWWTTNQQMMFADSWTADRDYSELCVWFYVTQDDVTFQPGSWQARLFVDDVQMTSPQRFEIVPGM